MLEKERTERENVILRGGEVRERGRGRSERRGGQEGGRRYRANEKGGEGCSQNSNGGRKGEKSGSKVVGVME